MYLLTISLKKYFCELTLKIPCVTLMFITTERCPVKQFKISRLKLTG